MIDQTTLDGKVITAAFDLAASPGWAEVSLRDIADAAGVSLSDAMERFEDKSDVIRVFAEHVDHAMLAGAGDVEREQSARDAVFEVIMSRFDAMVPYKAGLKSIVGDRTAAFPPDPAMVRMALRTQNKILQAAGISSTGGQALMRQIGLARVYGQVFHIWLNEDDPGMSRTMAALDKRLRQGERTLRTVDDIAKSSERACARAASVASRLFCALKSTTERRDNNDDEAAPDLTDVTPGPASPPDDAAGNAPG
jgi:ubiquinone biosynthesis protein COQ9